MQCSHRPAATGQQLAPGREKPCVWGGGREVEALRVCGGGNHEQRVFLRFSHLRFKRENVIGAIETGMALKRQRAQMLMTTTMQNEALGLVQPP